MEAQRLRSPEIVLIDEAQKTYFSLIETVKEQQSKGKSKTFESQLLDSINQKISFLMQDPFYGNSIPKKFIPKRYGVKSLWRVELAGYWRMLYTIKSDTIEIICLVLDILSHKRYDKRFGYKKK